MKYEIGSVFTEVGGTKCHYLGKYEKLHFAYSEGKDRIISFLKLPKTCLEVSDKGFNYLKERYPSKGQYFIGTNDKEYVF